MIVKEAIDRALKVIDEYSMMGEQVNPTQVMDYRIRMLEFANDFQDDIESIARVEATFPHKFTQTSNYDYKDVEHMLPADFKEIKEVLLDGKTFPFFKIRKSVTGKAFWYNSAYSGAFTIYYYKKLEGITSEEDEFEIEDEASKVSPYFMAYMATKTEKPRLSESIYAAYNQRIGIYTARKLNEEKANDGYSGIVDVTGW